MRLSIYSILSARVTVSERMEFSNTYKSQQHSISHNIVLAHDRPANQGHARAIGSNWFAQDDQATQQQGHAHSEEDHAFGVFGGRDPRYERRFVGNVRGWQACRHHCRGGGAHEAILPRQELLWDTPQVVCAFGFLGVQKQEQKGCVRSADMARQPGVHAFPGLDIKGLSERKGPITSRNPRKCVWLAENILPQVFQAEPSKRRECRNLISHHLISTSRVRSVQQYRKMPFLIKTYLWYSAAALYLWKFSIPSSAYAVIAFSGSHCNFAFPVLRCLFQSTIIRLFFPNPLFQKNWKSWWTQYNLTIQILQSLRISYCSVAITLSSTLTLSCWSPLPLWPLTMVAAAWWEFSAPLRKNQSTWQPKWQRVVLFLLYEWFDRLWMTGTRSGTTPMANTATNYNHCNNCNTLQHNPLTHNTTHCNILQHAITHCNFNPLPLTATRCNTLHYSERSHADSKFQLVSENLFACLWGANGVHVALLYWHWRRERLDWTSENNCYKTV